MRVLLIRSRRVFQPARKGFAYETQDWSGLANRFWRSEGLAVGISGRTHTRLLIWLPCVGDAR